jgi:hypothetical protein
MDRTERFAACLSRSGLPGPGSGRCLAASVRPLPRGQRLTPAFGSRATPCSALATLPGTFIPASDR